MPSNATQRALGTYKMASASSSKDPTNEVKRKQSSSSVASNKEGRSNRKKSLEKIGTEKQPITSHNTDGEEVKLKSKAPVSESIEDPGKSQSFTPSAQAQAIITPEYNEGAIISQLHDGDQLGMDHDVNLLGMMGTADLMAISPVQNNLFNTGTIQQDFLQIPKPSPNIIKSDIDGSDATLVGGKTLSKVDGWKFKLLICLFVTWFFFFIALCVTVGIYSVLALENKAVNEANKNTSTLVVQDIGQFKQFQNLTLDSISEKTNTTELSIVSLSFQLRQELAAIDSEFQPSHQFFTKVTNLGLSEETAIDSCGDLPPNFPSGFYFIKSSDGTAIRLFCNMTFSCNGVIGGWTKVVDFDTSTDSCSNQFRLRPNLRSCVVRNSGCTSITLNTPNVQYSRVCGRIIGFQIGHVNGFSGRTVDDQSIDSNYVDGISLTRGNPREHIWTFVAERDPTIGQQDRATACPCLESISGNPGGIPAFVDENYFCGTGSTKDSVSSGEEFPNAPLWEGEGCSGINSCCEFNRPPYFYRALQRPSSDDIEMRVCVDEDATAENVAFRRVEIFIR